MQHVRRWLWLLPGLLLVVSLTMGFPASKVAHAQTTLTVTDCSSDSQLQQDVTQANSDNANDSINFACSGDITLFGGGPSITGSMTIDGSGHSVVLDGVQQWQVFDLRSSANLTLNDLTISNTNFTEDGVGAISNAGGTVTIRNSTLSNNSAGGTLDSGSGGAISNLGGTVSISNSTFASNSATGSSDSGGSGGAIFNEVGTVSISNSTFASNSATGSSSRGGSGGAISNLGGTVSISNSTFASNSATGSSSSGGAIYNAGGTVSSAGSIMADNTALHGNDCHGSISDTGYNLESGTDCGFTGTGSLQNTDPKLDANGLQDNGGPTATIALQSSSPAIDHIPAASCPATDQRGASRPDDSESTCDIGAYESGAQFPDKDLGLTNIPATITTNATSPQGAVVTFTPPTVVDEDSSLPTVSCTSASGLTSGSTFPIGTTKVTCTVSDSDDVNSPVSASFTVTVIDSDLGLTNVPANITVDATSPQGAVVTYSAPTAVDEENPLPAVSCDHASGSTFPIGTTRVTCTVSDSDDTPGSVSQSFTVTVKGAAAQVSDLISLVNSFGLPADFQASFDTQLQAVQTDLTNTNTTQACRDLTAFINHAQSQSGKGLTTAQAKQLITAARQVQAVLGC